MGQKPLTDAECIEAFQAVQTFGTQTNAAIAMGIPRATFQNRYNKYFSRNLDHRYPDGIVVPGQEIKSESHQLDSDGNIKSSSVKTDRARDDLADIPEGHTVKGISTLIDGNGNTIQTWYKTVIDRDNAESAVESIQDAFKDWKRPNFKIAEPVDFSADTTCLYPLPDLHLGLFAWGSETGEDWDVPIAIDAYQNGMGRINAASPASESAIILGGGDLLHADNSENRTMKSGNTLDVDTRYSKVLGKAGELLVYQIELALTKHKTAHVRILPGNHDEHSAIAMTWFLHAWYRDVDRVVIDTDPSLFWWFEFGKTLLGATHGHAAKLIDMPMIMAARMSEAWGRTKHRYAHGFHVHHKTQRVFEAGGIVTESHQAPTAQDAYHHQHGYLAGRSLSSITYHRENGEIGRARITL